MCEVCQRRGLLLFDHESSSTFNIFSIGHKYNFISLRVYLFSIRYVHPTQNKFLINIKMKYSIIYQLPLLL